MREEEILDATCGGRSIWLEGNKDREDTLYVDIRGSYTTKQSGRNYSIEPDEVQDFRDLDYEDGSFNVVVFDPPHLVKEGGMDNLSGYLENNYGALNKESWKEDIAQGFEELWKVLADKGVLVFKFADNDIYWSELVDLFPVNPLLGTTTKQRSNMETRWFVFYKTD